MWTPVCLKHYEKNGYKNIFPLNFRISRTEHKEQPGDLGDVMLNPLETDLFYAFGAIWCLLTTLHMNN